MWQAVKEAIFAGLQYLYGVTGDYGFAIILLTVFVRLAMTPLTVKQTRSMYELQRIQPKIKQIQKKYKNDKEKQQEEILKFYQENKVNPFGGCLPLFLQMPVFIALYQVLGGTAQNPGLFLQHVASLPQAAQDEATRFWVFLPDLTAMPTAVWAAEGLVPVLPYVALVVLFGLSVWVPTMLMPGESQQKQIALFMAVFMLYIGWISPAGVLLYWVVSAVLGILQQQIQLKYLKKREES